MTRSPPTQRLWQVDFDPDCKAWFDQLAQPVQVRLLAALTVLRERGPMLGRPLAETLKGTNLPNLKELRVQVGGDPWRILYAFDNNRRGVLFCGGCKTGDQRWYEVHIPIAEARAKDHGF